MLPQETLGLLDRLTKKGNRSKLIDEAIRFYVNETARSDLRNQLKRGALNRAKRDLNLAREWFPLEQEMWEKGKG